MYKVSTTFEAQVKKKKRNSKLLPKTLCSIVDKFEWQVRILSDQYKRLFFD